MDRRGFLAFLAMLVGLPRKLWQEAPALPWWHASSTPIEDISAGAHLHIDQALTQISVDYVKESVRAGDFLAVEDGLLGQLEGEDKTFWWAIEPSDPGERVGGRP